jgi:hypothetical protein
MSAPNTNLETQEKRHRPVLAVLRALIAGALVALVGFAGYQVFSGTERPEAAFGDPARFEAGGEASAAVD